MAEHHRMQIIGVQIIGLIFASRQMYVGYTTTAGFCVFAYGGIVGSLSVNIII